MFVFLSLTSFSFSFYSLLLHQLTISSRNVSHQEIVERFKSDCGFICFTPAVVSCVLFFLIAVFFVFFFLCLFYALVIMDIIDF